MNIQFGQVKFGKDFEEHDNVDDLVEGLLKELDDLYSPFVPPKLTAVQQSFQDQVQYIQNNFSQLKLFLLSKFNMKCSEEALIQIARGSLEKQKHFLRSIGRDIKVMQIWQEKASGFYWIRNAALPQTFKNPFEEGRLLLISNRYEANAVCKLFKSICKKLFKLSLEYQRISYKLQEEIDNLNPPSEKNTLQL